MKYFYSIIVLLIGLLNYQYGMNSVIYLSLNIVLFTLIFISNKKRTITYRMVELLIISWPVSWINIFGGNTSDLQLPWYYIIGFLLVISILLQKKITHVFNGKRIILINYIFLLLYSIVPLILAVNFSNGLGDYIMLLFFLIIMLTSYVTKVSITQEEALELRKMFVFINLICAIGIIFQYIMYKNSGVIFFKLSRTGSFNGSNQIGCSLLFEDTSCSTIMLGCGFIYAILLAHHKKVNYIYALIILIGLALTSRRTSLLSLIIIIIPLLLNTEKGVIKKMGMFILVPIVFATALFFLNLSRPADSIKQYTSDTGRFADYKSSIKVSLQNPMGIGYGDTYLASLMTNNIIPHNTILRWTNQGGLLLTIPLIIIFADVLFLAKKKKMTMELWNLAYVFLASNFIPDILNSRFLIIIILIVFLNKRGETNNETKTNDLYSNI